MRSQVRRMGNSSGVIIPKTLLSELDLKAGDSVEIATAEGQLVLSPVRSQARAGWADEARAIVAAGEDELAWPDFEEPEDGGLVW